MTRINFQTELKNFAAAAEKAAAAEARLFTLALSLARMGKVTEAAAVIAAVEEVGAKYPTALGGLVAKFRRRVRGIGFSRTLEGSWALNKSGLSPDAPAPANAGTWEPTPKSRAPKSPEQELKAAKKAAESSISRAVHAAKKGGMSEAQALAAFRKAWLEA